MNALQQTLVPGPMRAPAPAAPPATLAIPLSTRPCIAVVGLRLCGQDAVPGHLGLAWYCLIHNH